MQYKDEPDYSFIRGKLKQIFERTQSICRFNSRCFDKYEDHNSNFRVVNTIYPSIPQFPTLNDLNMSMNQPFKFVKDSLQSQMYLPQYPENKTYMTYQGQPDLETQFNIPKSLNQTLNQNIGFCLPTAGMLPPITRTNMVKLPLPDYDHPESANGLGLSLNQILGLPYQIVMPQTEINQSISINNLPSLNDLAIRSGINAGLNTGMGTIFGIE